MKFAFFLLLMVAIVDACWEKGKPRPELEPGSLGELGKRSMKRPGDIAPPPTEECLNGPYLNYDMGAGRDDAWDQKRAGFMQCVAPWKEGDFVLGLEIWSSDWHIHGIKFKYNGSTDYTIGVQNCGDGDCTKENRHAVADFDGHPITKFTIADNSKHGEKKGDAVGGIHIEWANGTKNITVGPETSNMKMIDVGEGNLLGAKGWVDGYGGTADPGGMLRSLYPFFLGKINTAKKVPEIVAMTALFDLEALNEAQEGIEEEQVAEMVQVNLNFDEGTLWEFSGTRIQRWMSSYSSMSGQMFGSKTSITASAKIEVPLVFAAELSLTQDFEYQSREESTITEGEESEIHAGYKTGSAVDNSLIPMGMGVHCVATQGKGMYAGRYQEMVEVMVEDELYTFNRTGFQKRNSFTTVQTSCRWGTAAELTGNPLAEFATSPQGNYNGTQNRPPLSASAGAINSLVNAPVSTVAASINTVNTPVSVINAPAVSTLVSVVSVAASPKPATAST